MATHLLKCPCGYSWQHAGPEPLPTDVSTICPVCTNRRHPSSGQSGDKPKSASASMALEPGQVLMGFEILEELNRGGMGVVYKARQLGLNRLVALKVIAADRLTHPEFLARFRREVQAAALLSHPNIVTVYHTDLDGPCPYLAMEYVAGIDLYRLVRRVGPLPVHVACYYTLQAAYGLQHAFEQGLVHRDIKPANLMVTPSPLDTPPTPAARRPRVKILDMGLARVIAHEGNEALGGLTQAGEFLGTPDYMAPEQAEDSRHADIRSDLYSLGGTLYFLLTGEAPFGSVNLIQKLRRQLTEPPPSVARERQDVPPAVDRLIARLLDVDPAKRCQTPAELITALEEILRNPSGQTQPGAAIPVAAPRQTPLSAAPSTHTPVSQVRAHDNGVKALSLSPDGQLLLSGGRDEMLRLWETGRLREVRCIAGDVGPVEDVALAPGGKWAACCALRLFREDMVVQLWDLASSTVLRRLQGSADSLICVAVSADSRRVAAGSADRTVRVWAIDQAGNPSVCLKGHTDKVSCVVFVPSGESLLTGSHDGTVRLWDTRTGALKSMMNANVGKVLALAFGGATKRIAVAGDVLQVRQANGSFTALCGHRGPVLSVSFTRDGELLASGGSDSTVRVWRSADGEEVRSFEGHEGSVESVAFAPDGSSVFSGGVDGTIRRWPLPV